jgi:hypothetical protein
MLLLKLEDLVNKKILGILILIIIVIAIILIILGMEI